MQADTLTKPESHTLIASDRVEGTAVRRSNAEKIGVIERIMIDKVSGKVAYAVLSFGGFLVAGILRGEIAAREHQKLLEYALRRRMSG